MGVKCPKKNLNALSCNVYLRAGCHMPQRHKVSIQFVVHDTWDESTWNWTVAWVLFPRVSMLWLPDVTACDQISQSLPPLYLHTVSNQRTEVGMAWERGYLRCIKDWMNTKNTFHIISLEKKMIWVFDVIFDHFSTGHTHCPTQSHAHMLYFRLSLPAMRA